LILGVEGKAVICDRAVPDLMVAVAVADEVASVLAQIAFTCGE
jgi:hypothetical protein